MGELDLTKFSTKHSPRPHINSLIRMHHSFSDEDRLSAAKSAGWNVFQFPSEMLCGGDLLSDSGTTTLTTEQFSALVLGDESYGSNWGYFQLLEIIEDTFGLKSGEWEIYLFHQARAAEHALFSNIREKKEGNIIPSNSFFDTTRANAEANNFKALDLVNNNLANDLEDPFKGNMNLIKLEETLNKYSEQIPLVYSTITNNTGGGQPVSLENLKETRKLCDKHNIPLFLDACRFAENAWFIKQREKSFFHSTIKEIVKEEFSYADGFTISFKKDGLANMGGALAIKKNTSITDRYPQLLDKLRDHQILVEGHPTYGGLSGRDIMTIIEGLKTVVNESYLKGRIGQVNSFGNYLRELDIPVVEPFGGHAVYINTDQFFEGTMMQREDFGGISLTGLLLLKGVRLCELGAFAFGTYNSETHQQKFPKYNFVRAAIPRNKYELEDLYYVADCIKGLHDVRDQIPRAVPVWGHEKALRHFKAKFELTPKKNANVAMKRALLYN
jgi:tryptophanase